MSKPIMLNHKPKDMSDDEYKFFTTRQIPFKEKKMKVAVGFSTGDLLEVEAPEDTEIKEILDLLAEPGDFIGFSNAAILKDKIQFIRFVSAEEDAIDETDTTVL